MSLVITNINRPLGQTNSEKELKKPQSIEKSDEVSGVLEASSDKDQASLNRTELNDAANHVNALFQTENRSLQFNIDESSGRTVIKVVDVETGEQIKQIPSEELLELSRKLAAQLESDDVTGMLVKSRA